MQEKYHYLLQTQIEKLQNIFPTVLKETITEREHIAVAPMSNIFTLDTKPDPFQPQPASLYTQRPKSVGSIFPESSHTLKYFLFPWKQHSLNISSKDGLGCLLSTFLTRNGITKKEDHYLLFKICLYMSESPFLLSIYSIPLLCIYCVPV